MSRESSSEAEEELEFRSAKSFSPPPANRGAHARGNGEDGLRSSTGTPSHRDLLVPCSSSRSNSRQLAGDHASPSRQSVRPSAEPRNASRRNEADGSGIALQSGPGGEVDELVSAPDEEANHIGEHRIDDQEEEETIEVETPNGDDSNGPSRTLKPSPTETLGPAPRSSSDPLALVSNTSSRHSSASAQNNNIVEAPPIASSSTWSAKGGRGIPIVEIPLLPVSILRHYYLPTTLLAPTRSSRKRLLAPSSRSSSVATISDSSTTPTTRARPNRRIRAFSLSDDEEVLRVANRPHWRHDDESSSDLGGYGESSIDEDEDDDDMSGGSSSDGISRKRVTRANGRRSGGREEARVTRSKQTTQSKFNAMPSDRFYGGKSSSRNMPARSGRPVNGYRLGRSALSSEDLEDNGNGLDSDGIISEFEEVDELDSESASDMSDDYGKQGARGKQITGLRKQILTEHKPYCEKCGKGPADELLEKALKKKARGKPKKRKRDDDAFSDEELARTMEGWLTCRRCVISSHWGCLPANLRKEVLMELQDKAGPVEFGNPKIRTVAIDEEAQFYCVKCSIPDACFVCHGKDITAAEAVKQDDEVANSGVDDEVVITGTSELVKPNTNGADSTEKLMFRCERCQQCVHYEHLKNDFDGQRSHGLYETAQHYQLPTTKKGDRWTCHQCREWVWAVDIIIAWRPSPPDAKEDLSPDEIPDGKVILPREYLVKWAGRGFRHVTWVPHAWLLPNAKQKLRNFLKDGPSLDLITDETLAARGDDLVTPTIAQVMDEDDRRRDKKGEHRGLDGEVKKDQWVGAGYPPDAMAVASIPIAWSTVDRVLDVMLLPPPTKPKSKAKPQASKKNARNQRVIVSASMSASSSSNGDTFTQASIVDGIEPPKSEQMPIDEWEEATGRELDDRDVDEVAGLVTWCFVKWDDLQYDQSTWDTPPPVDSPLYPAFKHALKRYLSARKVTVPILGPAECKKRDLLASKYDKPPPEQPACVVGGKLMPFQMEGFQWLLYKHFMRESCILADDMGLGKTIQIASLLGYLGSETYSIYPFLVVVPNSTITNWVREFEKWVPHMRVVPYYGEAASRKVISRYELYHKGLQGKAAGLNAHVVLTTYDMITGSEFHIFRNIPRWEMLVVDEGQRLKSDSNLIFNRLRTLKTVHRILLTGTPLNNNIRELFNLLNFLEPADFPNLEELEQRFDQDKLNEGLIGELHEMIKPYILRRIKADVLKLPPKVEIIVPISLSPAQKKVYKGILEHNAELLKAMLNSRQKKVRKAKPKPEPKAESKSVAEEVGDGDPVEVDDDDEVKEVQVKGEKDGKQDGLVNGHSGGGHGDKDEEGSTAVAGAQPVVGKTELDTNGSPAVVSKGVEGRDDEAMEVDQAVGA